MCDGAEAELSDEALQLLDHAEHQIELAFRLATYSDHADGMARVIDRFARVEGALADHAAKLRTALVARPAASAKGSVRAPKPALRGTQSFGSLAVKGEKPDDAFDNGHHDLTAMPIEEDEEEAEAEAATTSESKQAETSKKQAGGKYLVVAPVAGDGVGAVEPYDKSLKKSRTCCRTPEMHDQAAAVDGGDAAVERTARERCCSFLGGLGGIINPSGPFRLAWDVVIALFIFFVLITEPLSMGFWQGKPDRPKSNLQTYGGSAWAYGASAPGRPIGVVNDIMDCIFLVDLWQRQYLAAIYWAFTTMTTVGYGDITPAGDMDRVYAIFAMLIGVSFYSYIIASVSSMVSSVDTKNAVYFEKMEELSSWMDHYGLEPALKRRVRRFFKQFYADHSAIDDQYILERLSPVLQEAISTYLLHDYILEHSLFNELPEGSLWKIMLIVRNMTFETGAIIVQKGEINVTLFILHTGEVVMEVGEQRRTLDAGDSFGELCLLGVNSESEVTVTALSRAKFFYIRRDAFLEAFSNFPEVFDTMYEKRELFAAKTLTHRGGSQANRKNRHGTRMRNKTMLDGLREGILGKDHKNEKVKKSAYTRLATVKEKLRKTVGKKSKAT
ncbi:voltage-gated potassium channel [Aureococcus anophagefferens]|nr:voltage-gated potassium channel [Aureococcus anophagefferens]